MVGTIKRLARINNNNVSGHSSALAAKSIVVELVLGITIGILNSAGKLRQPKK